MTSVRWTISQYSEVALASRFESLFAEVDGSCHGMIGHVTGTALPVRYSRVLLAVASGPGRAKGPSPLVPR
jgi:hypothetical protein